MLLCGSVRGSTATVLDPEIRDALSTARQVWCEFPPTEVLASSPLLALHGLSPDPLSAALDDPLEQRLAVACERLDLDRAMLESTRPWLAAQIIDGAHSTACGIESSLSIDTVISGVAVDIGVPVRYEYPTAEDAFGLFSGLRSSVELKYLRWTLDRSIHPPRTCEAAANAWERGSVTDLTDETNSFELAYPELFDVLVMTRNRAWAERIHELMHTDQSAVVVVGAGHLVGAGAIPKLLEARGITFQPN